MKILVCCLAWALLVMTALSGDAVWGDSGVIQSQRRSLGKPRRARPFSAAVVEPRSEAPKEHIEPRVNAKADGQPESEAAITSVSNAPTDLQSSRDAGIKILQNRALSRGETAGKTDLISEPTAAIRKNSVLLTANEFAAFTSNVKTRVFEPVDPQRLFGPSPHGDFCCDQSVVYDKSRDLMIWLLQYDADREQNVLRLAVAQGRDIERKVWHFYEVSPQAVGGFSQRYFDFSSLTLGKNYVYVTTNIAPTGQTEKFDRGVVLRLSLEPLARYQALSYDAFSVDGLVELRATEGATTTMYWASHVFSPADTLRVFSWPEESDSIRFSDAAVDPWRSVREGNPDFKVWLGRIDAAITAAWFARGRLGFAWTAGMDSSHPRPHIRVAIFDQRDLANVVEQPHIWSNDFTYAYPSTAPNSQGIVGVTLQYSGDNIPPSHAVGVLRGSQWSLVSTKKGSDAPMSHESWGDYLSIQPDGQGWIATGYTLQRGRTAANVENLVIRFAIP